LRSLQTLRTAVSALKSISARHFRETRREIEPASIYRDAVEQMAAWSGVQLAAGVGPAGLLVIGGELGLCGGYNSRVVAAAVARRQELGPGPTLCVGHRTATMLRRRGVDLTAVYATPTSVDGITRALLPLAEAILSTYAGQRLRSLDTVSSVFTGVGSHVPQAVRMLPIVAPVSPDAPTVRYVRDDQLAAAAARELLYIRIYDLLLDAMACEHSARLVASQAAERWLDQRSEQLERQLASTRREASTQEVLEIASGARARRRRLPAAVKWRA
jgi:F-type H+-transporting ATPase subunit gamma